MNDVLGRSPCDTGAPAYPGAPVLAPLAQRYRGAPGVIPPEAGGVAWAMPVVLRIERDAPQRTPLLEAAAEAALAVCLDPRSQPGGEWYDDVATWIAGRIRKIARRARGKHWEAVQDLPGVTVDEGGDTPAQVRALVPGPVDAVPKIVSRLQIEGTDLPSDSPPPPPPGVPVIWLNPAVEMTVGKAAAQVGHASMLWAAVRAMTEVPHFAVRTADPARWTALCDAVERGDGVAVRDAGFTEVEPGTITCIAVGP